MSIATSLMPEGGIASSTISNWRESVNLNGVIPGMPLCLTKSSARRSFEKTSANGKPVDFSLQVKSDPATSATVSLGIFSKRMSQTTPE
jgi:hypothetical protein